MYVVIVVITEDFREKMFGNYVIIKIVSNKYNGNFFSEKMKLLTLQHNFHNTNL